MKKIIQATMAIGLAIGLSGCIKMSMDLTIDQHDLVSGTVVLAVADSLSELMEESPSPSESPGETVDGLFDKSIPNLKITKITEGGFTGEKYEFSGTPLASMKTTEKDSGAFSLERVGDNIIASGNFDMNNGSSDAMDQETKDMADMMFAGADLHITVTFPGEVTSTNGTLSADKRTVTWKLDIGSKNVIQAESYSPLKSPSAFHWFTTSTGLAVTSIGALIVLLVAVLAISKRRKPQAAEVLEDYDEPSAASDEASSEPTDPEVVKDFE